MVSKQKFFTLILFIALSVYIIPNIQAYAASTATIQYHINKEWAIIWINLDRSIELHYNITITYDSSALGYITVGLPKKDFQIHSVKDVFGRGLSYMDISSGDIYAVEVYLGHPMNPGESGTVILVATIPNMLKPDQMNPGYWGMQFNTTYFPDARVIDLRVAIVPPLGVTEENVKTSELAFVTTVDGAFAVYWERNDLPPNTQLTFGVSIPKQYIILPGLNIWFYIGILLLIIAVMIVFVIIFRRRRKAFYEKPRITIEALGPRGGLTAVEAAVVVGLKPVRVLNMILFGLILKGLIMIKEIDPLIKIEKTDVNQKSTTNPTPRYYEIDFLRSIEADSTLDEQKLARTYLSVRDNVDRKMRGYSRRDTINYYKSIVENAWNQVMKAGTPQLTQEAIENYIEWLLVDENYNKKFRSLPSDIIIMPQPYWYWYWYSPHFSQKPVQPTQIPKTPIEVKPIPIQEWANSIVRGLEKTTNNLVKNVEDFTRKLVPSQPAPSKSSVHRKSSCVCACAHCACACACVSCACACAAGGAR